MKITTFFTIILSTLLFYIYCQQIKPQRQSNIFPPFYKYTKQFNKKYDDTQYLFRQKVYKDNLQYIKKLNCQACGVNKFSDLKPYEMNKFKGLLQSNLLLNKVQVQLEKKVAPSIKNQQNNQIITKTDDSISQSLNDTQLPSTFDWRSKDAITSIKNQGSCGSCWAFSTAAFFESDLIINQNQTKQIDLSQQFLLECDNRSFGCEGGYTFYTMQKVINYYGGMPTQKQYSYNPSSISTQGMCQQTNLIKIDQDRQLIEYYNIIDQNFIKKLILQKPINIHICSFDMQYYSPTIFSRTLQCNINNTIRDHAVLLIGYTPDQWIVKNQWGEQWGIQGYGYISRNPNNDCCIGTQLYTTGVVSLTENCTVQNCSICVEETACSKCKQGYYVTNNNNQHKCVQCKMQNCKQCMNYYGVCNYCIEGYSVIYPNYNCQKWTVQNCSFMYKSQCQQCNKGYLLDQKDKKCIKQ